MCKICQQVYEVRAAASGEGSVRCVYCGREIEPRQFWFDAAKLRTARDAGLRRASGPSSAPTAWLNAWGRGWIPVEPRWTSVHYSLAGPVPGLLYVFDPKLGEVFPVNSADLTRQEPPAAVRRSRFGRR